MKLQIKNEIKFKDIIEKLEEINKSKKSQDSNQSEIRLSLLIKF